VEVVRQPGDLVAHVLQSRDASVQGDQEFKIVGIGWVVNIIIELEADLAVLRERHCIHVQHVILHDRVVAGPGNLDLELAFYGQRTVYGQDARGITRRKYAARPYRRTGSLYHTVTTEPAAQDVNLTGVQHS